MKYVLTIAGSDCSGGAGIQADLKTFCRHGVYGASAVTAVVAENTRVVSRVDAVDAAMVDEQLRCIFDDLSIDAVKIGMVSDPRIIAVIKKYLTANSARNIVCDPVMVATAGGSLSNPSAVEALKREIFPISTVITPNLYEAQVLSGIEIKAHSDMESAAKALFDAFGCAVLVKGGMFNGGCDDCLVDKSGVRWLYGKMIKVISTHGTGCTLSSAIAANLALENDVYNAVLKAKTYITECLAAGLEQKIKSGLL